MTRPRRTTHKIVSAARLAIQLAAILLLAGVVAPRGACAQGSQPAPEFQLLLNAREEILRYCIYRPAKRDVMAGALRGLARQLGPKYAAYFPKQLPATAEEVSEVYIATLRTIAASAPARAAGLTLKALVERSIDGYCRTLDSYSEYADEETARRAAEAQNPDYVGIGITFRRTTAGFFCSPFPGGPADLAGIGRGDELLEIDGAEARAMTLLEISGRLSGPVATSVQLKVKHADGVAETLKVPREQFSSTPLTFQEAEGAVRIGFRRINERAREDLRALLQTLPPNRPLTLDFRGCPGGDFVAAIHIAELFLPEKTVIAKIETIEGRETKYSFNRAPYRPKSLRLLQDEHTASGAELIIAALLNHPTVKTESRGEKTFGKGVTSLPIQVRRGGVLKITDSRVYGPRDEYWDGEGLPPSSDARPDAP